MLASALGVDCREFVDPNIKPPPVQEPKLRGRPRKATPAGKPSTVKSPRKRRRGGADDPNRDVGGEG